MSLLTKQKQSHRRRKRTYGYRVGKDAREKGVNWDIVTDIYTLLYKQIVNKNVLYRTGNSTQYYVMTYMGKEFEKEWMYV